MEPMNLGSPVSSPGSSPTTPYLPSFLMGDPQAGMPLKPKSPARLGRQVSFNGTPPTSQYVSPLASPPPQPLLNIRGLTREQPGPMPHTAEKPNGPPIRGLYDCVGLSSPYTPGGYRPHDNSSTFNQTNISLNQSSSVDPATNWVTVFGFPPSSAAVILAQFSHYGSMVDTRSHRHGNWVHVRYQTRAETRRAIAQNGKVFGNTIMVGVVECNDPSILNEVRGKENADLSMLSTAGHPSNSFYADNTPNRSTILGQSFASPLNASYSNASYSSPLNATYMSGNDTTPSRNVRAVGQAYRNAQYSSEVQMTRSMPQKSTSMVSKAWGFLGF